MPEFWRSSGFHLLARNAAGQLAVSDDFLRAYLLRPEIHPVEESCAAERRLHAALMAAPRRAVAPTELEAIADADARDNYRLMLRFRDRLIEAGTLEACYAGLFRGDVIDVPPLFIDQLVHVILRNVLDGCEDALRLRAAELFFREQKATLRDGQVLLADAETVEMHAAGSRYGSLGRLIVEAQGGLGRVDLDVLGADTAERYWARESRFDTVIPIQLGSAALDALCRVIEAWVKHFHGVQVEVHAVPAIEEARWRWHIGLDAESTAILNALWDGGEVEAGRMRRIVALFRLTFAEREAMRADLAGAPVVLALSMNEDAVVRMKPQNLLTNLPLAAAA
ncbi:MAG: hypothetical protein AMJ64_06450 [Betaproteobacteria bacterium SG8_39]|nr:MAG: hypothetical protein AMJ64_06450 [Betaproteobacteria bacterium SG8_39]